MRLIRQLRHHELRTHIPTFVGDFVVESSLAYHEYTNKGCGPDSSYSTTSLYIPSTWERGDGEDLGLTALYVSHRSISEMIRHTV